MTMTRWLATAAAAAMLPAMAGAQMTMPMSGPMPGMKMPAKPTTKAKPKAKHRTKASEKTVPRRKAVRRPAARKTTPATPPPTPMPGMDMPPAPSAAPDSMPGMTMMPAPTPSPQATPGMDMDKPTAAGPQSMPGMDMSAPQAGTPPSTGKTGAMAGMAMDMGSKNQPGEGSGTSRLPALDGGMHGLHVMTGGWMIMVHGYAWGVGTDQSGPRGRSEAFVTSMGMVDARRELGGGTTLRLRSMLSLEPLMGAKGYPSLFATGETANGVTPLIDRQHPHDLFMELSARIDTPIKGNLSAFVYGGPVAEPALGPSAFMHRRSARYLPLAPITHHWFDSTHITYGVVTAGIYDGQWQIEGSAFRGREPDQHRWDIETPKLDSWSLRATWNPSPYWSAQVSYGRLKTPEALEPGVDEARTTASISYASGKVSALAGFSVKNRMPGRSLTAWLGELNWDLSDHHSLFGRVENVANDELFPNPADPLHDRTFRIMRAEAGYAYRLRLTKLLEAAIGGTGFVIAKPSALDSAYGKAPAGWTAFVKLSLGG